MTNFNVNEIKEATLKALGEDADVSYISEDELENASKADLKVFKPESLRWEMTGNSLTHYSDGHWEWWDDCLAKTRYTYTGNLNSSRLPNCLTGLIQYKMWG